MTVIFVHVSSDERTRRFPLSLIALLTLLVGALGVGVALGLSNGREASYVQLAGATLPLPAGALQAREQLPAIANMAQALESAIPSREAPAYYWLPAGGVLVMLGLSDSAGYRLHDQTTGSGLLTFGAPEAVRVGIDQRYLALRLPAHLSEAGKTYLATLYAVPAGSLIVTLVCVLLGPIPPHPAPLCDRLAGVLRLEAPLRATVEVSQLQAYQRKLAGLLGAYAGERSVLRGLLVGTREPAHAAELAEGLAAISRRAANAIAGLSANALTAGSLVALRSSFMRLAHDYSLLAHAARTRSQRALLDAERGLYGDDDALHPLMSAALDPLDSWVSRAASIG